MTYDRTAARVFATWFGCGYWPWGPGTMGSAAAIAIAVLFRLPAYWLAGLSLALFAIGIWASEKEAETSGRKDPGHVVVDEVVGQWITLCAAGSLNWKTCLAAFGLFRFFDILKPPPVRQLEALPGGAGIMADDVMAGLYGALVLAVTRWFNLY